MKSGARHSRAPSCFPPLSDSSSQVSVSCIPPNGSAPPQDKLDLIFQVIHESRLAIEQKMGALTTDISFLKNEHRKLVDKVKTNETKLAILEPTIEVHATHINKLTQQLEMVQKRAEDAEGHAHRNNIQILGLREESEGQMLTQYVKNWF
ncbi:hypothetical protein NDU88_005703 [Pleurodeles waltl]|uniref:Uncharacterized protein n=1 Tax=Pleurodeles waltl TaxID=8319 RepID=A0AAV7SMK3_PLEWA|nr:hypothetical protein NDU88_005703 [Pleurodeles waltl]